MGNHKVLKASGAGSVRYSMYDFIDYVHQQPVIWNHNHEHFHNREQREDAWHVIARRLYKSFDEVANDEKKKILETLTKRWKNTRDSFLRAHRLKKVDEEAHSYIYGREMQFLISASNEFGLDEDTSMAANTGDYNGGTENASKPKSSRRTRAPPTKKSSKTARKKRSSSGAGATGNAPTQPIKKRRTSDNYNLDTELEELCREVEDELHYSDEELLPAVGATPEAQSTIADVATIVLVPSSAAAAAGTTSNANTSKDEDPRKEEPIAHNQISGGGGGTASTNTSILAATNSPPSLQGNTNESDADQAFFDSIKPVIRSMSVDQKLDFQIEMLKLLKRFRTN